MSALQFVGTGLTEDLLTTLDLIEARKTVVIKKLGDLPLDARPYDRAELIQENDCLTRLAKVLRDPGLKEEYLK